VAVEVALALPILLELYLLQQQQLQLLEQQVLAVLVAQEQMEHLVYQQEMLVDNLVLEVFLLLVAVEVLEVEELTKLAAMAAMAVQVVEAEAVV
jgi:hypothetical protein